VLGGYFAVLAIAETIMNHLLPSRALWVVVSLFAVVMISLVAFYWMVGLSAEYMRERKDQGRPPLLPKPFPGLQDPSAGGQVATEKGS
jgi:hypothetical protein